MFWAAIGSGLAGEAKLWTLARSGVGIGVGGAASGGSIAGEKDGDGHPLGVAVPEVEEAPVGHDEALHQGKGQSQIPRPPIGLDIEAETPREIAVSILAEIIAVQRRKTTSDQ